MHLEITHVTGFSYQGPVVASYNEARMTPLTAPGQTVLWHQLDVDPTPHSYRYRDYWGTLVSAFELVEPHDKLSVRATSLVQVERREPVARWLTFDELADPALLEDLCEFLETTERVSPPADLAQLVVELSNTASAPRKLVPQLCQLVADRVRYQPGVTHVQGTAAEAWVAGAGVCQDHAHLAIGALRSVGIPARYVSGYLHPAQDAKVGETVLGESHAWIEWWDGDWASYDPTNARIPDNRYVRLASGRDYTDVAPLRGIFSGASTSDMFVQVEVTRRS